MVISVKRGMLIFFFGSLLIPCAARLSHYDGQYFVEPLRQLGELSDRAQSTPDLTDDISRVLRLWNTSWPTIVKLRLDSVNEHEFQKSAGQTYDVSQPCMNDVLLLAYADYENDGWAWQSKYRYCVELLPRKVDHFKTAMLSFIVLRAEPSHLRRVISGPFSRGLNGS